MVVPLMVDAVGSQHFQGEMSLGLLLTLCCCLVGGLWVVLDAHNVTAAGALPPLKCPVELHCLCDPLHKNPPVFAEAELHLLPLFDTSEMNKLRGCLGCMIT